MADKAKSNGFDGEQLRAIVGKIERCFGDLLSERGAYMNRCRGIREGITAAYDEAKAAGIPKKELRALIKTRDLERKIGEQYAELEADEQANYDMIIASLGEFANTPLGEAAVSAAKGREKPRGETLDSLTQP